MRDDLKKRATEIAKAPWSYASADISAVIEEMSAVGSSRQHLPNRRPNATVTAQWDNHDFTVTIGFDLTGRPVEVFADHAKGSMAAVLADACVLISIALQHGIPLYALRKSLGQVPTWQEDQTAPASPIGAIMAVVEAEVLG